MTLRSAYQTLKITCLLWVLAMSGQSFATDISSLNVLSQGVLGDAWDLGLNAYDQGISWGTCNNDGGADCPNIDWEFVADSERGQVLEIRHSSSGQSAGFFIKTSNPIDLSSFAGGDITFDVHVISGDSDISIKIDCVYPCTSGNYRIGSAGANGWRTVVVPVNDLVAQKLDLFQVDTGIVVWATRTRDTVFQIDNVRWEKANNNLEDGVAFSVPDDKWTPPNLFGYITPKSYPGHSLIWADEFSGNKLNSDDWTHEIGVGNNGWGNNELQYYRSQNTTIKEGLLIIEAKKEVYGDRGYTSSRIITQGKRSFTYGRIDIRAATPRGQGLWPALWMLGSNINSVGWPYSGEIDIMEMIGGSGRENSVFGTAHWNKGGLNAPYTPFSNAPYNGGPSNGYTLTTGDSLDQSFHVFSLIWTPDSLNWLIDDVQYNQMDINESSDLDAFKRSFFFVFNVAVGGNWPQSPDQTTEFPQRLLVDYVRVFAASLDIDGNGKYNALTDGLLLLRGMFGLTGDGLIGGAVASDAVYTTSADIEARIAMLGTLADIDGNGDVSALTDGLLALRYLFGLKGDALISGVIASDATRTNSVEIEAHIQSLTPAL